MNAGGSRLLKQETMRWTEAHTWCATSSVSGGGERGGERGGECGGEC